MTLDTSTTLSTSIHLVRQQFPALDRPGIFLDNPAGTQISKQSLERINRYLLESNANHELCVDIDIEQGAPDLNDFAKVLERKPKIAAFGYTSNLLGTINPVKKLIKMAKDAGALVYIDTVQYAPHGPIDVRDLDCDFLVCSSYKYSEPQIPRHVHSASPFAWSSERQNSDLLERFSKMGDGL